MLRGEAGWVEEMGEELLGVDLYLLRKKRRDGRTLLQFDSQLFFRWDDRAHCVCRTLTMFQCIYYGVRGLKIHSTPIDCG